MKGSGPPQTMWFGAMFAAGAVAGAVAAVSLVHHSTQDRSNPGHSPQSGADSSESRKASILGASSHSESSERGATDRASTASPDAAQADLERLAAELARLIQKNHPEITLPDLPSVDDSECSGSDCGPQQGESAGTILAQLEAAYRAQRDSASSDDFESERVDLDEERSEEARRSDDAEHSYDTEHSDRAEDAERSIRAEAVSAWAATESRESEDVGSEAPEPDTSSSVVVLDQSQHTNQTEVANTSVMIVNAPTWVAVPPAVDSSSTDDDRAAQDAPTTPAFGQPLVPTGTFLGVQGPRRAPASTRRTPTRRTGPGTPQSSIGRTPWDPIDMSRHNNPWGTSRIP